MKRIRVMTRQGSGILVAALCLFGAISAHAQSAVPGIIKDRSGAVLSGNIRYKKLSNVYVIEMTQGGARMVSEVKADDVMNMRIQEPRELAQAIKDVQSGRHSAAVPVLEKIERDYEMLQHDVAAARWLMECYLKQNKVNDAVRMGDKVLKNNPTGITAEFFAAYADALIAGNKTAQLRNMIKTAIESGNREAAAVAQIKRGDMEMQAGRYKDALRDGYLRTVLMFREVKSARPEALYKAFKCFTEIGQQRYAEDMRKKLLSEFPQSSYARQLGSG